MKHFYPRPPRGGRRVDLAAAIDRIHISIHALREEGDCSKVYTLDIAHSISIHALREEGDRLVQSVTIPAPVFLSTPSARRATAGAEIPATRSKHFYPRPPRGGRQSL